MNITNKIIDIECKVEECQRVLKILNDYQISINHDLEQYISTITRTHHHYEVDLEILRKAETVVNLERRKKYWHDNVLVRDHFRCQRCGSQHDLTVHHFIPKSKCSIEMRWAEYNGIVLCWECHKEWHDQFDASDNLRLFLIWLNNLN